MLKNILFWHKYRPNSFEKEQGKIPMILLPRIEKIIKGGIQLNFMFVGSGGVGKSTCAGILTQGTDCLIINCSDERGIDVVREQIADHCTNYNLLSVSAEKTVWLEEFDKATSGMRDALRAFMETNIEKVRFIATLNNLTKISRTEEDKALLSRFNIINFDPANDEEKKFIKDNQLKFLRSVAKSNNFEVTDLILESIIRQNFPNFRSSIQDLQELTISGDYEKFSESKRKANDEIFSFLFNGKNDIEENYFYVMDNYLQKTEDLLLLMNKPMFQYIIENKNELVLKKGSQLIKISKEYNAEYLSSLDPELHMISYITELKNILNG
jgi:DNA polymerase III delta prime subunit